MEISAFQLFQILKEKIGEEKAKTLAEYVEAKIEHQLVLNSKDSESNRKQDLLNLKTEFYLEINKSKVETIKLLFFVMIVLIVISAMLIGLSK